MPIGDRQIGCNCGKNVDNSTKIPNFPLDLLHPDRTSLANIKKLVEEWIGKQGHDSCWYYPEIFGQICKELNIDWIQPVLPPINEFKGGCQKYMLEIFKPFKDWVAVRDPNPEDINDEGEDKYWYISPKEHWEKHGTCKDGAEYLDIPFFSEAMEHCYICEKDISMEEQAKLLESMGFAIGDVEDWHYGVNPF